MKKILALALCLLFLPPLLAACSDLDAEEGSAAEPEPVETAEEPDVLQEDISPDDGRDPRAPYPERPDAGTLLEPTYWETIQIPASAHGIGIPFARGDYARAHGVNRQVGFYLACNRLLGAYETGHGRDRDGMNLTEYYLLPLEDYLYYAAGVAGERCADLALLAEDSSWERYYDAESGLVWVERPHFYNAESSRIDWAELARWRDRYTFSEILPLQGGDRVRLVFEHEDLHRTGTLGNYEDYVYVWDDAFGYVVESIERRWPETDRVELLGEVERFDSLFGLPAGDLDDWSGRSFQAHGDEMRRFWLSDERDALHCDVLDLATGEETVGRLVHRFAGEEIMLYEFRQGGLYVYTDTAVHRFDAGLRLLNSLPLPLQAPELSPYRTVCAASEDLSRLAYRGEEGLYLYEPAVSAEPRLVVEHPYIPHEPDWSDEVRVQTLGPIRFLDNNRLLARVYYYEWSGQMQIIHLDSGESTLIVPQGGSEEVLDEGGVLFNSYDEMRTTYYRFADGHTADASFIPWQYAGQFYDGHTYAWDTRHYSYLHREPDDYFLVERTGFYRSDFESGEFVELPFSVMGAEAKILCVGEKGDILFCYAYKGEQGFGLWRAGQSA